MKLFPSFNKDLNNLRLFFCINSGRSGSQYLSELLGTTKEVVSFHEPQPTMSGKYLQMINEAPYDETFNERSIKCKAIQKVLRKLKKNEVYCETNHMFIKTFFDVVMMEFNHDQIEVIILRRDLAKVLKSFIEMGYFATANIYWPHWMTKPDSITAAIPCLGSYDNMDQFDRSIAYLIDIEARAERFANDYPHVKIHNVFLEDLQSYEKVKAVCENLKVTPTRKTNKLSHRVSNKRLNIKNKIGISTTIEYCQERIAEYIENARLSGIKVPEGLAINMK